MIVFHPARRSFAEILAKWDRHVSHDYAEVAPGWNGSFRWALRALALAASPAFEVRRIFTSDRVYSARARIRHGTRRDTDPPLPIEKNAWPACQGIFGADGAPMESLKKIGPLIRRVER